MAEIRDYSNQPDPQTAARWPEGMAMASVNDTGRDDEGIIGRWEKDVNGSRVSAGNAGAYTVTPNRDIVSGQATPLYDGLEIAFIPHVDNAAGPTLNVQATGAKNIVDQNGRQLSAGELKTNYAVKVRYNTALDAYVAVGMVGSRVPWNEPASGQALETGSAPLATGDDSQRPASPGTGNIRFNTSSNRIEVYDDGAWRNVPDERDVYARGYIDGFQIEVVSGQEATQRRMNPGKLRNAGDTRNVTLSTALLKKIDDPWAKGDGNGGLFSGTVAANTSYHYCLITEDSSNDVDWGWDTDPGGANTPSGWTFQRRVGSIKTDGSSNLLKMTQEGDYFYYTELEFQTVTGVATGTSTSLHAIDRLPTGVKLRAEGTLRATSTSGTTTAAGVFSATVTQTTLNDGVQAQVNAGSGTPTTNGTWLAWCNTLAQLALARRSGDGNPVVVVFGWKDPRGKQ